ncbi:MAG: tryptophan synthase subunit alpha [Enterococcus cecorum]|nr:tryptophan synthase subunit alpha [Enterococcus cecorum]
MTKQTGQQRIQKAFHHKAFIPFITCGDPDLATSKAIIRTLAANGADIIELGIPFSDPTAEGPVIQEANLRALKNQVTTDDIFQMVADLRQDLTVPMVIMTYANVVFSYGIQRFIQKSQEVGIDGLILPDVPYEEKEEFNQVCQQYGLAFISLITPTSHERIAKIAKEANGFLYYVSSLGVTGVRSQINTDLGSMIAAVRKANPTISVAIGFGIATSEQAKQMSQLSDGIIIGSAIVKQIGQHQQKAPEILAEYAKSIIQNIR